MSANFTPVSQLLDLSGKTAIITGAGKGIGKGIACRLAEAGANIVVADFDYQSATQTQDELVKKGRRAKAIKVDVTNENDVLGLVAETVKEFGSLDILVNNAGIYPNVTLSNMKSTDFDKVISVNLKGVFLCTKYASQEMLKAGKGGRIINITSVDALHPSSVGLAHYDASKHGVWGFTKNVALELAPHKIWVTAIAPGAILTPGVENQANNDILKAFINKIPMHRMGNPDEIGKVALFLASDMSSYMTGSQIVVDGGVLLS